MGRCLRKQLGVPKNNFLFNTYRRKAGTCFTRLLSNKRKPFSQRIKTSILMSVFVLMWTKPAMAVDVCPAGTFKYTPNAGSDICLPCYDGSFMPHHQHTERLCFECTQIQNPDLEILVSPCDKFQDTEIHCIDGYFRTKPAYPEIRGHCQRCTECPYAKGGCHGTEDTLCCPAVSVNKEGTLECLRLCGQGQLLDLNKDQCLPCPANSFMDKEQHADIYCLPCNEPTSENEVIIHPCTSTQPASIGCKEGYYQQSTQVYPLQGCAKCQVCSENTFGHVYEARGCDKYRDTVCCSDPDMIVVDTPEGSQCQHLTTARTTLARIGLPYPQRCGRGEYLIIGRERHPASCLPCPAGTCMTETDHFRTSCLPCADLKDPMSSDQMMTSGYNKPTMWIIANFVVIFHSLGVVYSWF